MQTLQPSLSRSADELAANVFRTDFSKLGFGVMHADGTPTPRDFRELLVRTALDLGDWYQRHFGRLLLMRSLGRFDQQASTEPHRDGGPEESILLLGYEPTVVDSRLFLLDATRYAFERGLGVKEFMELHNPMVRNKQVSLAEYTTEVPGFEPGRYRIVAVNNSVLPYTERNSGMLGVLHQARIDRPQPDRERIVNSIVLCTADPGTAALVNPQAVLDFIERGDSVFAETNT